MKGDQDSGSGGGTPSAGPAAVPLPSGPDLSALQPGQVRRQPVSLWVAASSSLYLAIGVVCAVGVFFLLGALGEYDISFIIATLPQGFGPVQTSLIFTTFTFVLGFFGALGLGMVRAHPPRRDPGASRKRLRTRLSFLWRWPLYGFASGYVAAVRGTPFLVQLYIVYYVLIFNAPHFSYFGWDANYWAGFFALLLNTTGYQAEAIRGGFQSVDAGQIEGAKAVGMSRLQIFVRISVPQTLRLITLPLTNEWISNFKTATILSVIGIFELFDWTHTQVALYDARPVEAFVILAIFYLVINVTLSRVMTYVEKVRRIPGLGTPMPEASMSRRILGVGGKTAPKAAGIPPEAPSARDSTIRV